MKLSAIGEFSFIHRISSPFLKNLPDNIVGIGDDCAVIPWKKNKSLLVTTDMLIEDIHFLRSKISPQDLGYKSLAVNLSDIAAMGGIPDSAYLSLGIPKDIDVEWLDKFYTGFRNLAESEHVHLLGGDTTKSPTHIVINITVLGNANPKYIKYRSTAKQGDIICVTDFLGDSGAGLKCIIEDRTLDEDTKYLIQRHHRPRAHLAEGAWLAKQEGIHAMMDVSDGIDSDLRRIMERSICGVEINLECLPISSQLRNISQRFDWQINEIAIAGGEDYCLLTTIAKKRYTLISERFKKKFNRPLSKIGSIVNKDLGLKYYANGKKVEILKPGYDHFI
jgi:thiamine-monophosphate kinase